jgi:hypothetical protein
MNDGMRAYGHNAYDEKKGENAEPFNYATLRIDFLRHKQANDARCFQTGSHSIWPYSSTG